MSDEQWLQGLRDAARRADAEPVPGELDGPLGQDFQAQALARIMKERAATEGAGPAPVVPLRRRVGRVVAPLAAALALAAAVVLVVQSRDAGSALPDYVSVLGGAEQSLRGDAPAGRSYRPGSMFTLTLQPARDAGQVEVRFARVAGGRAQAVEPSHRISRAGSVTVEARASEVLGTTPGPVTFVVVVAPAGHMPAQWLDAARAGDAASLPGLRVVREAVTLTAD